VALSEKKNRGEWSELYSLVHILAYGSITSDQDGDPNSAYPVVRVARLVDGYEHNFQITNDSVEVLDETNKNVITAIKQAELRKSAEILFGKIKAGKGRSFSIPEASKIMEDLKIEKVLGSKGKSDISVTIYDPRISKESKQGFSIKSFIGSNPTLLNASGVTNIDYIIGGHLVEADVKTLNTLGPIELVTRLTEMGHSFTPSKIDPRFSENLKMIDGSMDLLLAYLVLASYQGRGRNMINIVDVLVTANPLNYEEKNSRIRYTHKIKDLLEAAALGMRPSESWSGDTEAKGGTIIVSSTGKVLCHHALDKTTLRNYLFENTYIDTPSRRRHRFGYISDNVLTLNFQIRFK
jgi:hypothetical protein